MNALLRYPVWFMPDGAILVIDDERAVADLAAAFLRRDGWQVETAYHPVEAISGFGGGAGITLVVSDFVMPVMNGCELVAELRRRKPDLRAVFMSGYVGDIMQCQCPVLPKPFRQADLVARVRAALADPVPVCVGLRRGPEKGLLRAVAPAM